MLKTKRMSIVPTLRCTLNCRLCSNHMPNFKEPYDVPYDEIIKDIDALFELFDYIEWLQFVGGEVFMVKYMADVYKYCLKYKDKFSKLIIETNATITPREEEIEALKQYNGNCEVMISDYGSLSMNKNKHIAAYEKNGIPYKVKKYYGDIEEQHYGGWLDNSRMVDMGESDDAVMELAKNCAQVRLENMHCFRGKLHRCSNSLFMTELGVVNPNADDYLNIHDNMMSKDEKTDVINRFYNTPRRSCHYCTWKNGSNDSKERYSAAEQIKRVF